jgi:hypothetical protein
MATRSAVVLTVVSIALAAAIFYHFNFRLVPYMQPLMVRHKETVPVAELSITDARAAAGWGHTRSNWAAGNIEQ